MNAFITSQEAFNHAKQKAHFGHRTWLVWPQRDGTWRAEYADGPVMKEAILAVGVRGRVHTVDGKHSFATWTGWRSLIHLWRRWTKWPQCRWH